jgi:hypothetical protein
LVNPDTLVIGQWYYSLLFLRPELDIADITTWIYVSKNLLDNNEKLVEDEWYFQDASSYLKHGNLVEISSDIKHNIYSLRLVDLHHIYDLNGLIEQLVIIKNRDLL